MNADNRAGVELGIAMVTAFGHDDPEAGKLLAQSLDPVAAATIMFLASSLAKHVESNGREMGLTFDDIWQHQVQRTYARLERLEAE